MGCKQIKVLLIFFLIFVLGSISFFSATPTVSINGLSTTPVNYYNLSEGNMTFVSGASVDIMGFVNGTNLANWTISLYNSSGVVNGTLCFNTSVENGTLCEWNTTYYCSLECENYSLVLNASDNASNSDSYEVEKITIDNIPPNLSNSNLIQGDDAFIRINITETYLNVVNSYLLNESNYTVIAWTSLINESQVEDQDDSESGTYNATWSKEVFYLNNTLTSAFFKYCDYCLVVPGCFKENDSENYDCGCHDDCDEEYNFWLVYNDSVSGSDKPFLGIGNDLWCGDGDCIINTTIIENGTSKFKPQTYYFNTSDGGDEDSSWIYYNSSEIVLYDVSGNQNLNLSQQNITNGTYKFMFTASDYGVMQNSIEDFEVSELSSDQFIFTVNKSILNSGQVYTGDVAQYLINITNTGDTNITNLTIVDIYDDGFNYTSASLAPDEINYSSRTVYWNNVSVSIPSNSSYLLYVNLTTASGDCNSSNQANVTAIDENADSQLNQGSVSIYIALPPPPLIEFESSTTQTGNYSQDWIFANVSANVSAGQIDSIIISLYNGSYDLINSSFNSSGGAIEFSYFFNFTGLSDGTYYLNSSVNNTLGNLNTTATRTIILDTTAPDVSIVYPLNSSYSINVSDLNYTVSEAGHCWWNNGSDNSTIVVAGVNWSDMTSVEGSNTWSVHCNDSSGNLNNSESVTFFKDSVIPYFSIIPSNQTINYSQAFSYDINATDSNFDSYFIENSNFAINRTSGLIINNTVLVPKIYLLNITINDSVGNKNSTLISVIVDFVNTTEFIANTSKEINMSVVDLILTIVTINNISDALTKAKLNTSAVANNSDLNHLKSIEINASSEVLGNLSWALINISYTSSELTARNITNESSLKIYYYNTSSSSWQLEPIQGLDSSGNYIWANVSHFSLFSIFGNNTNTTTVVVNDSDDDDDDDDSSSSGTGDTTSVAATGWTITYIITDEKFINGTSKMLGAKTRLRVKVNGVNHHVGVISLTTTLVTINVSSDPQQAIFSIGTGKKFDVLGDGYYDIYVKLEDISNSKANITVKSIHEEVIVTEQNEEVVSGEEVLSDGEVAKEVVDETVGDKKTSFWLGVLIFFVVLILLISIGVWYYYFYEKFFKKSFLKQGQSK